MDDATQLAEQLLQPLHERYIQHKKDHAASGARTRDGISGAEAAWDVTAMAIPIGVDIMKNAQLENTKDQRETFGMLIKQLSLLPGPHHAFAKQFADGRGDANTAYQLLHSYTCGERTSKRFQKLEIDPHWGKADLENTEELVREAETLVKEVKEKFATIEIISSQEVSKTYQEMRELFGEHGFFGIEENEKAFTLKNGEKLVDMSPAQRTEAQRLLEEKLRELRIVALVERVRSGEINKDDWMLILRVPTITVPAGSGGIYVEEVSEALERAVRTGSGTSRGGSRIVPLTMQTMQEYLAPDMLARGQSKLLYDIGWYRNEAFYTMQQSGNRDTSPESIAASGGVGAMHWQMVTRDVLTDSLYKNHTEQTELVRNSYGIEARRRTPVEIVQDFFLRLRSVGDRTMCKPYKDDWSDVRTARGGFVSVGGGVQIGLRVYADAPLDRHGRLGVSPSY